MEILKIENLKFTYPLCDEPAVNNVTLSVKRGEFIGVCGATGCGKTTLLRLLKREIAPVGDVGGNVFFEGTPINDLSDERSACDIGFVMQNPEHQIVADKVWHELAFGLENMNIPQSETARRVAETAAYFGIEDWFDKNVCELSGGQKQLLNLASVMIMRPKILILDEPTSQLDPIAAAEFTATLKKLNRELALTVIIAEHRLEDIIPECDRLLVLDSGGVLAFDTPQKVIEKLPDNSPILNLMPSAVRLYKRVGGRGEVPLSVRQGRNFVENGFKNVVKTVTVSDYSHGESCALEFSNTFFRYGRNLPDVLCGLSLKVYEGEIFCLLGGNGSGKTTALSAAAGLIKPYSGKISVFGKRIESYKNQSLYRECLAMLPQDVQTVFLKNTVREEIGNAEPPFDISRLYSKHPYDLSGGEQQLLALAKVLSGNPRILLADEPTKGLDANAKQELIKIIKKLKSDGVTVVIVTHDVEFAAQCADRCALFFRGKTVSCGVPNDFFAKNSFYTTAISRMTSGYYGNAVTVDDAVALCALNGKKDGV